MGPGREPFGIGPLAAGAPWVVGAGVRGFCPVGPAAGRPVLFGVAGRPVLFGIAGCPVLFGVAGRPVLFGVEGRPVLLGVAGRPVLFGVAGRPADPPDGGAEWAAGCGAAAGLDGDGAVLWAGAGAGGFFSWAGRAPEASMKTAIAAILQRPTATRIWGCTDMVFLSYVDVRRM